MTSSSTRIDPQTIDAIIEKVSANVASYTISKENLVKFGDKEYDKWCLSYVHGEGGYYVKFLASLVKTLDLKEIAELGNREGLSTLGIFDALSQDARFTTIDIEEDQRYCPDAMFKDSRVKFIFGDVSDMSIINQVPSNIELLFSDTIHYNFQIQDEFEIYQHLLADVALVAIDDIHVNDKGLFWDKVPYRKWDLTQLCHHAGWGLFLYERKENLSESEKRAKAAEASARIWKRKFDESERVLEQTLGKKFNRLKIKLRDKVRKHPALHRTSVKIRKSLGLIK